MSIQKAGAPVNPFDVMLPGDIGYVDPTKSRGPLVDEEEPGTKGPLSPEHKRRHNARVKIELGGPRRARLEKLANYKGCTLTALIRLCIDEQISVMESLWFKIQSP
jgi:hypothetical protein